MKIFNFDPRILGLKILDSVPMFDEIIDYQLK